MDYAGILGNGFKLRGTCPHCSSESAFPTVTTAYEEERFGFGAYRKAAVACCMACNRCILAIIGVKSYDGGVPVWCYEAHYPRGAPNDIVSPEIPEHIQLDFREALRCRFVDAYNATAEMCRRALEASCLDQGAPKRVRLDDMIDWLETERKITPRLRDIAHKIRLGGNRGAHPPEDGPKQLGEITLEDGPIEIIEAEHADAIIMFTREFFHHIYVVPAELDKFDFSKPRKASPPTPL